MSILDSVKQLFSEQGLQYDQIDGKPALRMGFGGLNGRFMSFLDVDEERRLLRFVTASPINVPAHRRPAASDLVTRLNWLTHNGCLEMDMAKGEICLRTETWVGQADPDTEMLEHLVYRNLVLLDSYLPVIVSVTMANEEPETALQCLLDSHTRRDDQIQATAAHAPSFNRRPGGRLRGLFGDSTN